MVVICLDMVWSLESKKKNFTCSVPFLGDLGRTPLFRLWACDKCHQGREGSIWQLCWILRTKLYLSPYNMTVGLLFFKRIISMLPGCVMAPMIFNDFRDSLWFFRKSRYLVSGDSKCSVCRVWTLRDSRKLSDLYRHWVDRFFRLEIHNHLYV